MVGIDLGGTKIERAVLADGKEIVARTRIPTPREYAGTVDAIRDLVADARSLGPHGLRVGIGIPGAIDPRSGKVRNANSTWLNNRAFLQDIRDALVEDVRIENDANCFTLSEAKDGAARDFDSCFGVILGTGVGGGLTFGSRLHVGQNKIAGEWGHNALPWTTAIDAADRVACYCGKEGCVETYLSGPALERQYFQRTRQSLSAVDIGARGVDDPVAAELVDLYKDRLARAIAVVMNIIDPAVIVLGGGVSRLPDLATDLRRRIVDYVFAPSVDVSILLSQHGDSSGVRGAAWLWDD